MFRSSSLPFIYHIDHAKESTYANISNSYASRLLGALVNLVQEGLKDLLLQSLALVRLRNHLLDLPNTLLLILFIKLLKAKLVVKLLDLRLSILVLLTVVLLQNLALLRCGDGQSFVYQPRTLVIHDIRADLTNVLWVAEVVQVVVLDLEVLSERNENSLALLQVLLSRNAELVKSKGNWKVKGVVCSLIDDDELVFLHREVVQVDVVLWCGEQVAGLAELGLEGDLVEELHQVDVGGVLAEVLLEENVDGGLEHEGVVDGDHADTVLAVPTWGAAAGDGAVHDIVGDEEEALKELGHPAEGGGLEVVVLAELLALEKSDGVWHGHAAVAFSSDGIGIEGL